MVTLKDFIHDSKVHVIKFFFKKRARFLNLSLQRQLQRHVSVVLTFESVDEILWCDHSNEITSTELLHGAICFSIFYKSLMFGALGS